MLKRGMAIAAWLLVMTMGCACAEILTDAPGTPTQDVVTALEAVWQDAENTAYDLQVMQSDRLTMDTVTEIFEFVYKAENRPARYFPAETQRAIAQLYGIDPDILYMTEFMRLHAAQAEPQAELKARMTMDVKYQPGQLVVAVLGDISNPDATDWTPIPARVTQTGVIECDIPEELIKEIQGEDLFFSLLTVNPGGRVSSAEEQKRIKPENIPSKRAEDSTYVVRAEDGEGQPLASAFRLHVVSESEIIRKELSKLRTHIMQEQQPASTYLPLENQNELDLLAGDPDSVQQMPIFEYVSLITEDYCDTDGDSSAVLAFATPYVEGQTVITALGLPREDAQDSDPTLMNWHVQRAEVLKEGYVEIIFDQLALIGMGEEKGLLLIFSEPAAQ